MPLYRIECPWIVDLRVLHGLDGVASYYGTLPKNATDYNYKIKTFMIDNCLNFEIKILCQVSRCGSPSWMTDLVSEYTFI